MSFCVLSLIGVGLAVELTHIHYRTHTDPTYHALCAISDKVNCETVALSPYSTWLAVPVSAWGTLGYLLSAILAAWGISRKRLHAVWPFGLLFTFSAVSILVSGYLAYVSVTKIDAICLYCNALYLVNLALLAVSSLALRRANLNPVTAIVVDLRSWALRLPSLLGIGLPAAGAAVALLVFWPQYGNSAGWDDLGGLPSGRTERGEHWIGAREPSITIVEYTDYECPFCRRAHRQIRQFLSAHATQVRLVHKHFPLDSKCNPLVTEAFHERACELSRFVSCAGQQGRFWSANDAVFSALDGTPAKALDLERIGVRLGLDLAGLRACLAKDDPAIIRDLSDGDRLFVTATPTYFIGGARYRGALSLQVLEDLLKGKTAP